MSLCFRVVAVRADEMSKCSLKTNARLETNYTDPGLPNWEGLSRGPEPPRNRSFSGGRRRRAMSAVATRLPENRLPENRLPENHRSAFLTISVVPRLLP